MNNTITFLLENAKYTIVSARIALTAISINNYRDYDDSVNGNTAGNPELNPELGFHTGTDLPLAWQYP